MGGNGSSQAASTGIGRKLADIMGSEAGFGYLLLVPALLVLIVFLAYPFAIGIWLSLTNSLVGVRGDFIGLANFKYELLGDTIFRAALVNTLVYTLVTTLFKLSLGILMALLLNQVFPLNRFVRAVLLLPWIVPSVLSTLGWRWMFDSNFSVINWAIVHSGASTHGVDWLGGPFTAMTALIVVNIWQGLPFYGISFLAGLQAIPRDLYEAARVDGATRWQQFRVITLPMLRPVLLVVLMLSTILTFADFQKPYILTNGGPYNSTQVLSTWAFSIGIPGSEIGLGAAISLFLFPVLAIVVAAITVLIRRPARRDHD